MRPFQIRGLAYEPFAGLFGMSTEELRGRRVVRQTVTHAPGFPCRVSLVDAAVGEVVVLAHYTHQPAESPFHASHAVYVRRDAVQAGLPVGEVPGMLRSRLLSVRAFNAADMMVRADVGEGGALESVIDAFFALDDVRYLQVHNAREGCYLARVDRVVTG